LQALERAPAIAPGIGGFGTHRQHSIVGTEGILQFAGTMQPDAVGI